ncbi:YceI family protein [Bacteroides coprosuis DSM 18011]|uniref:YceI family protein n=1 Tax=Bacteroides coprosuis DSM 18011 TaxID=679937 RepID=F3ZPC6_9BACE|nr:YceI family protein [Bacteroides coprosuis]EGJ71583.1 YceI family protein [Bacteroides coprosuis DSM 18011]HJD92865.1 YceI family protein [Bacteroides coprosuis]
MKQKPLFVLVAALGLAACGSGNKQKPIEATDAKEVATATQQTLRIDPATSVINWAGHKVGGSHHGVLSLTSGNLSIDKDQLLSGTFIIDMNSIVDKDLTDGKLNDMLVNHLKSADFFDVEKYPEASFQITSTTLLSDNYYQIEGNLKMKEETKNITFNATITLENDIYTAVTDTFAIDRTQWGVNYGSKNIFKDLKDKIIEDNMDVQIVITAK